MIGVVLNVAIAWLLALTADVYRSPPQGGMALFEEVHWTTQAHKGIGSLVATSAWRHGENPGQTQADPADYVPAWMPDRDASDALRSGEVVYIERTVEARGWPMLSMWASLRWSAVNNDRRIVQSQGIEGAIETGLAPWVMYRNTRPNSTANLRPRILPLRPLWPGFAVNGVAFGAGIWLVVFGWRDVRAAWRMRRHCCPRCGYPVGTSPQCSECGAVIAPRADRVTP